MLRTTAGSPMLVTVTTASTGAATPVRDEARRDCPTSKEHPEIVIVRDEHARGIETRFVPQVQTTTSLKVGGPWLRVAYDRIGEADF